MNRRNAILGWAVWMLARRRLRSEIRGWTQRASALRGQVARSRRRGGSRGDLGASARRRLPSLGR